jgi:hypothetical protein
VSRRPAPLGRAAAAVAGAGLGGTAVVSCWLCGIHTSTEFMVADGGVACKDLRWYCKDTRSCTWRWATPSARHANVATTVAHDPDKRHDESSASDIVRQKRT